MLGYTAEEYIGQPIMKFTCPDEEEPVLSRSSRSCMVTLTLTPDPDSNPNPNPNPNPITPHPLTLTLTLTLTRYWAILLMLLSGVCWSQVLATMTQARCCK